MTRENGIIKEDLRAPFAPPRQDVTDVVIDV
jgi:hypothetical protein